MTKPRLHSEQIYQAMVDDEAFANLPTILAQSVWRTIMRHQLT